MSPDRSELLARVLSFDIDGGQVALPFAARLAREHGWSRGYAARVITEYKRYLFLAATAGFPVCPSEDVDAAWHLHLTYTRSYWKRLCGDVLGRPLHHEPTKSGPAEGQKHLAMYAATLAAYGAAFGYDAPADIWPGATERFGAAARHRVVNTARNWIIPKAPVTRVAQLTAALVLVAVAAPGCNGGPNPFALKNNDFLLVLGIATIGAVCAGRVIRSTMRTPNPTSEDDDVQLNWEQTAYLGGGAGRLTTAAVARLVGRGLAKVGNDGKTLTATGHPPDDTTAVERAVLGALPVANERIALSPVQKAVDAAFAPEAERLDEGGFTLPMARQVGISLASLVPLALVLLALALPRIVMGIGGNRPTTNLFIISFVGTVLGAALTLAGSLRLSNRGAARLAKQKERHEPLKAGTRWESGGDAGMAVALFGTAVLAGTAIAPLQTWYPRQTGAASSSGCSGGCGSGCGGDSGGGDGCGGGCGGGD